ncbi:GH92 family glycosyl hydrolase [Chitinophaga sp. LS1]|uniref:GH92 family glycosyl hydrolase n=1 Tax=Chitinophaga sp. LS1 TaxID=3051176 RepID=UPI002AAAB3DD|nr:GH92 family glycosyl hydrolase [Chitinophaga sp. LS1]WPV65850.1 GH92 family glycosyl hydrolase [Chitinophaga sp. LS1]
MNLTANIRYILLLILFSNAAGAQVKSPVAYVNPFIGTTKSAVLTKWGNEGGCYPGAVAPHGYYQLTPETRRTGAKGYDYQDSSICYFTCEDHHSGFPGGSAGSVFVMPVSNSQSFDADHYCRRFSHKDEYAEPGYYKVLFRDDQTLVEMTASRDGGVFRFTFLDKGTPEVFPDKGTSKNISAKDKPANFSAKGTPHIFTSTPLQFNIKPIEQQVLTNGTVYTFPKGTTIIEARIGNEQRSFDAVRAATYKQWNDLLSVVEINDDNEKGKAIFYTALYHSLLLPWLNEGKYSGFSPWDTFRTLHPLLSLLYPDLQAAMIRSMLDVYHSTGHLPTESMTGNHSIPIITDAYFKGIPMDKEEVYKAMQKSINDTPYLQADMPAYHELGYVPSTYPESVTRTVEYAYDDWALNLFAKEAMHEKVSDDRSLAFQQLLHIPSLFLLPRNKDVFKLNPGNTGYKEGDQWVYSFFVPQHPRELINRMGGDELFSLRLDTALEKQHIIFDNETVFHVPYLFNDANRPDLTQLWVRKIMKDRFSNTPGGLPGNDDLGSTSSWYIFSAMGLYPVAPGKPLYALGIPAFREMKIHLKEGKVLTIKSNDTHAPYVQQVRLNGVAYKGLNMAHEFIKRGGTLEFETGVVPVVTRDNVNRTVIRLTEISMDSVATPDQPFPIGFTLINNGDAGVYRIKVTLNGKLYGSKNCLIGKGARLRDSIQVYLYKAGENILQLNEQAERTVQLKVPLANVAPVISDLVLKPLIKKDSVQHIAFAVMNKQGTKKAFTIPVNLNGKVFYTAKLILEPGEQKVVTCQVKVVVTGWQTVSIGGISERFKVYKDPMESLLLSLEGTKDVSGFENDGQVIRSENSKEGTGNGQIIIAEKSQHVTASGNTVASDNSQSISASGNSPKAANPLFGPDYYIEVPNARSLDELGTTLTMMAWIYPTEQTPGLVDVFSKGDTHVLQITNGRMLSFFAGGWGRGDITVPLPEHWLNHWHHIAGVCDKQGLKLYIDGVLKGETKLDTPVNLSVGNKWTLGRNEEFPGTRIFKGYIQQAKVFFDPIEITDCKCIGEIPVL